VFCLWFIQLFPSLPGYNLPWEDPSFQYPGNFARPLEVAIEASNGASDYGNKFGEPVLAGKTGNVEGYWTPMPRGNWEGVCYPGVEVLGWGQDHFPHLLMSTFQALPAPWASSSQMVSGVSGSSPSCLVGALGQWKLSI
jgi:hypothetical protein